MSDDRSRGSYAVVMDNVLNLLTLARINHETRPFVGPDMEDWSQRCERFLEELPEVLDDLVAWPAHPACSSVMDVQTIIPSSSLDDVEDDIRILFGKAAALTARRELNQHVNPVANRSYLALDIPIRGEVTANSMASALGSMSYRHASMGRPFEDEFRHKTDGYCEKCSLLAERIAGPEWGPVRVWGHRKTHCTPEHQTLTMEAIDEIKSLRIEGRRDLSRYHALEEDA